MKLTVAPGATFATSCGVVKRVADVVPNLAVRTKTSARGIFPAFFKVSVTSKFPWASFAALVPSERRLTEGGR